MPNTTQVWFLKLNHKLHIYPDKLPFHGICIKPIILCSIAELLGFWSLMHFRWTFKFQKEFQLCSLQKGKQLDTSAYLNYQRKLLSFQELTLAKFWRRVHRFLMEYIQHYISRCPKWITSFCVYHGQGERKSFLWLS